MADLGRRVILPWSYLGGWHFKLCFAMTINKSQGQSFKIIGVDLQDQVFTHGQFYVAMSRVTDVNNICILRVTDEEGIGEKLLNIVFLRF